MSPERQRSKADSNDPSPDRERRGAARWIPGAPCDAKLIADGRTIHARVEDFSASGAGLVADESPHADAKLEFQVQMGPDLLRIPARVARVSDIDNGAESRSIGLQYERKGDDPFPLIDVRHVNVDPGLALRLPASVALRRRVLPMCLINGVVQLACADLQDSAALHSLERYFDHPIAPQQADAASLLTALHKLYGESLASREAADDPVGACDEVLYAAWLRRASDVHIDPDRDGVRIRLRVDGQLEDYRRLQSSQLAELISRIKVLGGMDIAEKRAPQDGSFSHAPSASSKFDVRVATLPTKHGERATLRLLALDGASITLEQLGMDQGDMARFEQAISRPHGLILTTGPTGCGKTTTLSAGLRRIIVARAVNAIAVQDPVEYDIPGVAQVEVDTGRKLSFATALRSILRHDPDVILIGEIRDAETLDIALKAALTGHLVLASLHTNSAASAVTRLIDMGADRYLVAATLRLVAAQRLVRRLCPYCRRGVQATAEHALALGRPDFEGQLVFEPAGCVYCAGRGYGGRMGLFELLPFDAELARAVADGAEEDRLAALGHARGIPDIADNARRLLGSGATSIQEVLLAVAS